MNEGFCHQPVIPGKSCPGARFGEASACSLFPFPFNVFALQCMLTQ